ncbi:hypothetical protein CAEBREN_14893 [Caenorhabditis brenneri]|uniref:7TM GPCR serpentine receptor class x (Srx) domain-containing protein n=1 Tax=Caenorhabditis brenneri TaxID=135651 RepID=G0MD75_CAEBE|nr:hypothetical protein CAEBREN_14893 [Caenorhabditis brenneri]
MLTKIFIQNAGYYIILASTVGLIMNFSVFSQFLKSERTSFYIMCTSQSVSNILTSMIYFGYIGVSYVLYLPLGPSWLNGYMNQSVGYGLIVMGSLTQMMITINRFLVVFFTLYSRVRDVSKYSNQVTVVGLAVCWMSSGWLSVLPGWSEHCFIKSSLDHLGWSSTPCSINFGYLMFATLLIIGITSNFLNILIARKLMVSAKNQSLSSEMSKKRRENAKKFFIQSLCQDWIYVLQMLICYYFIRWFEKDTVGQFMSEMGCDVLVPVVDGLIMFSFNYREKKTLREIKNSNNSDSMKAFEKPKISVCSVK